MAILPLIVVPGDRFAEIVHSTEMAWLVGHVRICRSQLVWVNISKAALFTAGFIWPFLEFDVSCPCLFMFCSFAVFT